MMKAACHCGAVRFEVGAAPEWVLNCTVCRRYGSLWAYPDAGQESVLKMSDPGVTETYVRGDRELAFHRCRACGCLTHMEAIGAEPNQVKFGFCGRGRVGKGPYCLGCSPLALRHRDQGMKTRSGYGACRC